MLPRIYLMPHRCPARLRAIGHRRFRQIAKPQPRRPPAEILVAAAKWSRMASTPLDRRGALHNAQARVAIQSAHQKGPDLHARQMDNNATCRFPVCRPRSHRVQMRCAWTVSRPLCPVLSNGLPGVLPGGLHAAGRVPGYAARHRQTAVRYRNGRQGRWDRLVRADARGGSKIRQGDRA